ETDVLTIADFIAADGWLAARGDTTIAGRIVLATLRTEIVPASARAHFSLARLLLAQRDTVAATASSQRAADLLAADGDPQLDSELRAQVLDLAQRLDSAAKR
ncbi:MAG: hypothetical protein H7066_00955, partial [Cytophagaceae bacterium]|nr:hypothetical protein [Gemmatimonadaceae bacterium]